MSATLEFWFDLASPYSALSAARITSVASGLTLRWRPFLLGPIFKGQGWDDTPFNLYPAKGRWMWRDVPRRGARSGLKMHQPSVFPRLSVLAGRVAIVALMEGWGDACVKATFRAEFEQDADIASVDVMTRLVDGLGHEGKAAVARAQTQPIKDTLRAHTAEAAHRGVFGAPTFFVGDELFWGDDRLEDAVAWARGERAAG